ncbi:serine protease SohB [Atopomonas hussainii]|uniref:Serine protease SohB n=1 Tax=Atopomonas hussainii TaxID=1429083 RepID=A0A1H7PWZ2_9GAMM|nr:protease SohB [Atopomonas hussainii]SEL39775.1 serine protease SohB [Atopomonas hussainii]
MEHLIEYAGFLAKTVTVVIAIIVVLSMAAALRMRGREQGSLQVSKLNDFYDDLRDELKEQVVDKAELKAERKAEAKAEKARKKAAKKGEVDEVKSRTYVLDFDGDIKASAVDQLRHEVSAVLSLARSEDEIVLRLESPGGMVHGYGLAASQLARIRSAGVPLTICVDKVAASGGYMMACLGQRILAAPFAMIGSIGVVAQVPNLHRLLKKHDIDYDVFTAGEFKRTVTVFGENNDKGKEKFQQDLEDTHEQFKSFISQYRPQVKIDQVATGEVWLGQVAVSQQLVDEVMTSDEYLTRRAKEGDVFQLRYVEKKSLQERFGLGAAVALDRFMLNWVSRLQQRYWS